MDDMQKIFDYASWFFLMLFAVPTVLIMASWSSLPGEPMFAVKRSFEQALLFAVKPSYNTEAKLNIQYTQRRLSETKVLLAKNKSGEGIHYLRQQIAATKVLIEKAPDQATKKKLAATYVSMLREVSSDLTQQRQQMAYVAPRNTVQNVEVVVQTPTIIPTTVVSTQAPVPTTAPVDSTGENNQNDSFQIDQSDTSPTIDSTQTDSVAETANQLDVAVAETTEAINSMVAISEEPVESEDDHGNNRGGNGNNSENNNGNNGGNNDKQGENAGG